MHGYGGKDDKYGYSWPQVVRYDGGYGYGNPHLEDGYGYGGEYDKDGYSGGYVYGGGYNKGGYGGGHGFGGGYFGGAGGRHGYDGGYGGGHEYRGRHGYGVHPVHEKFFSGSIGKPFDMVLGDGGIFGKRNRR